MRVSRGGTWRTGSLRSGRVRAGLVAAGREDQSEHPVTDEDDRHKKRLETDVP